MNNEDTIHLTKECNAGIKMAIESINEVLDHVQTTNFKQILERSKKEHDKIQEKTHDFLAYLGEEEKEPNPMAKGMSWLKTNIKLTMKDSDATAADLITEGCNMGVKTLRKYLNQYPAADEKAKEIAKQVIEVEKKLTDDISIYL